MIPNHAVLLSLLSFSYLDRNIDNAFPIYQFNTCLKIKQYLNTIFAKRKLIKNYRIYKSLNYG